MNTQVLELDIGKRGPCAACVRVAQGESGGTTIKALVYDNGAELDLAGWSAWLVARLPDRVHYYRAAASAADNVATHVCDEAKLCSAPGYTDEAYFEFVKGEVTVQTERFALDILRSALEGQKPAESWDTEVADLLERGQSAVKKGEQAVKDAVDAANAVNTAVTRANTAASSADSAAGEATRAASSATTAAGNADSATSAASTAAGKANTAAAEANAARDKANTAADKADTAAGKANAAASDAVEAASAATTSAADVNISKEAATAAAEEARKAAEEARSAVSNGKKLYLGYDGRYLSLYHIKD